MGGRRRHPHIPGTTSGPESHVPREAGLSGEFRSRLPLSCHRAGFRHKGEPILSGGLPGERIPSHNDFARNRRACSRGFRQNQPIPLHLQPACDQACAGRSAGPVDFRRHRVQLAAASSPFHLHAGGSLCGGRRRRRSRGARHRAPRARAGGRST